MPRSVLIGGVGYRHLRDYSVGVMASDRLEEREWPAHVRVQDLSFNPVAVVQQLEEELAGPHADLMLILISAAARGRSPGTVTVYRWDGRLPPPERVQDAVAEAVTGVIAVDNTLMVGRQFGGLPEDVVVIEIEPAVEEFGQELSERVAPALERAMEIATNVALDPDAAERIPLETLGGGAMPRMRVP